MIQKIRHPKKVLQSLLLYYHKCAHYFTTTSHGTTIPQLTRKPKNISTAEKSITYNLSMT